MPGRIDVAFKECAQGILTRFTKSRAKPGTTIVGNASMAASDAATAITDCSEPP
jgi:hypothetical protein